MSGYLHFRATANKWKKLWFVLKDQVLYSYKAPEDTVASETTPILGYDLELDIEVPSDVGCGRGFRLCHVGCLPMEFCSESDSTAEKWTAALREAVAFF